MKIVLGIVSFLFLVSILTDLVHSEYSQARNMDEVQTIQEDIKIFENKTAKFHADIEILNSTPADNYFTFQVSNENQSISEFNCHVIIRNLKNNSVNSIDYKNLNKTDSISIFYEEHRTVWFKHTEPSYVRLICDYNIENYAQTIGTGGWLIHDEFPNKHLLYFFNVNLNIPKGMIFTEINPATIIESCGPNLGYECGQRLTFTWSKDREHKSPKIYLKYDKTSLNFFDILQRHFNEFVLGGLIGAIIAIFFEKTLEILLNKIRKKIKKQK